MRTKSWGLSALMGCMLLILLWVVLERVLTPTVPTAGRKGTAQTSLPENLPPEHIAPSERHVRSDRKSENLDRDKDRGDANRDRGIVVNERPADIETPQPPPQRPVTNSENTARNPLRPPFAQGVPLQSAKRPPFREKFNKKGSRPGNSNLPKNIPAWFKYYDTDGDGQVSLAEWKDREDNTGEFARYDLNRDGFISVEELIRSGQFATGTMSPQVVNGIHAEVGDFFYFEVTGATQGGVWGSDVYTTDSPIAVVAVHAGVLRDGETALIKVTVLAGQQHYYGSVANGVTTHDHHAGYPRSFTVEGIR